MARDAKLSVDYKPLHRSEASGIGLHNEREEGKNHGNPDIDDSRTHLNYSLIDQQAGTLLQRTDQRIAEGRTGENSDRKIQKNAILLQSVIVQVNKEYFDGLGPEETKRFFEAANEHLADKFGKDNVISAQVHMDEKAPHAHFEIVPLRDGKLVGGQFKKNDLAALHTDLAKALNERGFAVERGTPSPTKERVSLAQHKAQELAAFEKKLTAQEADLAEREAKIKEAAQSFEPDRHAVVKIAESAKRKNPIFGKPTVELPAEQFDFLFREAEAAAMLKADNRRLGNLADGAMDARKLRSDLDKERSAHAEERKAHTQTREQLSSLHGALYDALSQQHGNDDRRIAGALLKSGINEKTAARIVADNSPASGKNSSDALAYGKRIVSEVGKTATVGKTKSVGGGIGLGGDNRRAERPKDQDRPTGGGGGSMSHGRDREEEIQKLMEETGMSREQAAKIIEPD